MIFSGLKSQLELVRGTLDVLILKALVWGSLHGYAITSLIRRQTDEALLVEEGTLCPLHALRNLLQVCPARGDDPLFSWIDTTGQVRPLTTERALNTINNILVRHGWGTKFGHSFRIGGASFYLSQGVSTDIVRIAAYIRSFEQVSSRHLANLGHRYGL